MISRGVELWRTSIQMRVVTSVMAVSVLVIGILGFALVSIVAQRLLDAKSSVASEEIDRARVVVEQSIESASTNELQAQLNLGREALAERSAAADKGALTVYEPVLIAPTGHGDEIASSPTDAKIPEPLRNVVKQDQIAYQYSTIESPNGTSYSALIIGTPTSSEIDGLELYLVMPMVSEESTLALVRGLFLGATVVVTMLLVGISWFFANQVTTPVRQAARIAERFAAGHLRERMAVEGEDEMARLAVSFNKMAESLSLQIRQLEEYGDLQRQFTSDVSHELRTPLTTVRMAADMIADSADELDPSTRRASELMIDELDRFEMLLADLLEISRHDAGVADLSAENIDVRRCVESAYQQLQVVALESGTAVRFDMPDEPVPAHVDARRVERVIRNLMANAIDHSEGNPVDVAVRSNGSTVAFTVTDHGVGLKPEQEELVFNRFWRADPSRVRRTGGTGLGLAIAREDAQLHGGRLEAHGAPGIGSCFRLMVPVQQGTELGDAPLPLHVPGEPVQSDAIEPPPTVSSLAAKSQEKGVKISDVVSTTEPAAGIEPLADRQEGQRP
ncbi:MtrAB system histidine kinase MtrB [Corynebacterium sp. H113]|uniref:MtrAB system histidine kinase MtrB n=1 Tax=Corynebacterium sp. H113 TaxID=3133419 RepID=UPI0030B17A0C